MLMCIVGLSGMQEYVVLAGCPLHNAIGDLKTIGKEFQKNCYKTIFRKINTEEIFFQLTLITNKDYFSRKKLFCENFLSQYM